MENQVYIVNNELEKYRLVYAGGEDFLTQYLKPLSVYETHAQFQARKEMTPIPAFAKEAIQDVKNSIYQRASDVSRQTESMSLANAWAGLNGGMDNESSNMSKFMNEKVLPELLVAGEVGIYLDNANDVPSTLIGNIHPYAYIYKKEQILKVTKKCNVITALLLEDCNDIYDEDGLIEGQKRSYRLYKNINGQVSVTFKEEQTDIGVTIDLAIPEIPFIILSITQSLLTDIANHQIALLNLGSSDVNYAWQSNFPIFTEQQNIATQTFDALKKSQEGKAATAGEVERKIGIKQGIKYSTNAERPGFIHPSSEPLKVSMEKADSIKGEIRALLNLSLRNITGQRESAESKDRDSEGLTSGLAYIGMELERGENLLASYWYNYMQDGVSIIKYPRNYSLKDDESKLAEADKKLSVMSKINSISFQKIMAKGIIEELISSKVSPELLNKAMEEIDSADVILIDPKMISKDIEDGVLSHEYAEKLKHYPLGTSKQAEKEHVQRLTEIARSQSSVSNDGSDTDFVVEKVEKVDTSIELDGKKKKQRGENKNPLDGE